MNSNRIRFKNQMRRHKRRPASWQDVARIIRVTWPTADEIFYSNPMLRWANGESRAELPFPRPRTEEEAKVLRDHFNDMVNAYLNSPFREAR